MNFLKIMNYEIYLSEGDTITNSLFKGIYGYDLDKKKVCALNTILVIPEPSFLAKFLLLNKENVLVVRFNKKSEKTVVEQLFNLFNFHDIDPITYFPNTSKLKKNSKGRKILLFSNYIDSGFFRKWFVDKELFVKKCKNFKKEGFSIWHVGTQQDKKNDKQTYNFVDKDLRGNLSLSELVDIVKYNDVKLVCFDNFVMHLGHFFDRETHILFRGRITKLAFDFHINCVNLCLAKNKSTCHYL